MTVKTMTPDHTEQWQKLYILTEHWKSDIAFYQDELQFLYNLVDKYFIWLSDESHIKQVQHIATEIYQCKQQTLALEKDATLHLRALEALMDNPFGNDEQKMKDDHIRLEKDLADYAKKFRQLKRTVFAITEEVIESEKLQHLLTP